MKKHLFIVIGSFLNKNVMEQIHNMVSHSGERIHLDSRSVSELRHVSITIDHITLATQVPCEIINVFKNIVAVNCDATEIKELEGALASFESSPVSN